MKGIQLLAATLLLSAGVIVGCKDKAKEQTTESVEVDQVEFTGQDGHTSQNSLDWAATYKGVLPCADCSGIETILTLNEDSTYTLSTLYQGKQEVPTQKSGSFEWDPTGSVVILDQNGDSQRYKVAEGYLLMLNTAGEISTGELADLYKLNQQ